MKQVRLANAKDLPEAASVLADAFQDYPWTRWTIDPDDHQHRIKQLQYAWMSSLGLPSGLIWIGQNLDEIASVAVWMDTSTSIPPDTTAELNRITASLEGSRHSASLDAEEQVRGLRPSGRHLLLGVVGTAQRFPGQGIGREVLQPGLNLANSLGVPCYLETSSESNVGFYERIGFRVSGQLRVRDSGPEIWGMVKLP